jgi:hypothetical protein
MARATVPKPSALCLEPLESRHAPAKLLGPTALTYQDKDGDIVIVSFSRPVLAAGAPGTIFTFDSGPGAVNGSAAAKEQLRRIDLTGVPAAATGTSIRVTAVRSPATGGDGFAAVGEVVATGIDLGAVTIDGDLGRIRAGDGTLTTPGLNALAARSIGRYGTSTGAADMHTLVQGRLGSLSVRTDVADAEVEVEGGADGSIGAMTVGGSVVGGAGPSAGIIRASGTLGRAVIRGDIVGGAGMPSGFVGAGTIGNLSVGGSVIGGSASGNANLSASGFVGANHIKALTVGGSLVAGTDATTGYFSGNGIVFATYEIGSVTIKGSVLGNPTNPAVISAGGQQFAAGGADLAIGSVTVRGRVEHGLIEAGTAPDGNFVFVPTNADAQIGSVTVGGDWVASSIAAGVTTGADGWFGTPDDARARGPGVKDDPAVASRVGRVRIGGQVLGSVGGSDHYGIVAENVGAMTVGGTAIALVAGNGNDHLPAGLTGDFSIDEV